MNRKLRMVTGGCVVALALLLAGALPAEAEQPFAGFYHAKEVADLGDEVRVKLTIRVFNYTGADVIGATVTLEEPLMPEKVWGTFAAKADIRDKENVLLSDEFTIPRIAFEQWNKGASPHIRLGYTDANGKSVMKLAELAPDLLVEEE